MGRRITLMPKILVVEDDDEVAESVVNWLKMENYNVERASSGEDALQFLSNYYFDIVLLDWGLPKMSGYEVLKSYRSMGGQAPVLFLTGRDDVDSKEFGLDGGADDYITKPFDMRELTSRVRARLRRPGGLLPAKIVRGNVTLDPETRKVFLDSSSVRLTNKEYAVLEFLMRHPDQVFSSRAILDAVWAADTESSEDTVRACIKNLRRKITVEGQPCVVKTLAGSGYTIES